MGGWTVDLSTVQVGKKSEDKVTGLQGRLHPGLVLAELMWVVEALRQSVRFNYVR